MKLITLHDHLNPDQEVEVDAEQIVVISVFGSGSALSMSNGSTIGVHETPSEVTQLVRSCT